MVIFVTVAHFQCLKQFPRGLCIGCCSEIVRLDALSNAWPSWKCRGNCCSVTPWIQLSQYCLITKSNTLCSPKCILMYVSSVIVSASGGQYCSVNVCESNLAIDRLLSNCRGIFVRTSRIISELLFYAMSSEPHAAVLCSSVAVWVSINDCVSLYWLYCISYAYFAHDCVTDLTDVTTS